MIAISVVNMKGGVSKTTLSVNIADCLVRRHELRTLVIDIDPQFNATQCLISGAKYVQGLKDGRNTVLDIFDDRARPIATSVGESSLKEAQSLDQIKPWSVRGNLHLMPGNLELYRLEMAPGQGREHRLKRFVDILRKNADFDLVIIDTPPTPSVWMSSALIASEYYLVPVKPEPLSATGIDLLRTVVGKIQENYNLQIKCAGVVLTISEEHTRVFKRTIKFIDTNRFWRGQRFRYTLPKRTKIALLQETQKFILDINDSYLKTCISGITKEFLTRIGESNA